MSKPATPPLLPEQRLERVVRIARADSVGVMIFAGLSLLFALPQEEWHFAGFAALALGCGYMEWHGHARLREGDSGGLQWLLGAQACLYTVIVAYVVWRWRHFSPDAYWAQIPAPAQTQLLERMRTSGLDPAADREPLLRMMNAVVCTALFGISTLFQCGLALWYRAQSSAIFTVLGNPSTPERDDD